MFLPRSLSSLSTTTSRQQQQFSMDEHRTPSFFCLQPAGHLPRLLAIGETTYHIVCFVYLFIIWFVIACNRWDHLSLFLAFFSTCFTFQVLALVNMWFVKKRPNQSSSSRAMLREEYSSLVDFFQSRLFIFVYKQHIYIWAIFTLFSIFPPNCWSFDISYKILKNICT